MADTQQNSNQVPDQGGVGFTRDESSNRQGGLSAGEANRQKDDPGQDAGNSNGKAWRPDVPDASGVGFTPDDDNAGTYGADAGNRQSAGQGSSAQGGQTAQSGIQSNFAHASPESNVGPAGAPQTSHGSAGRPIPGGTQGGQGAQQNSQLGMGASAAGGNPGTSAGSADVDQNRQGGNVGGSENSGIIDRVADRDNPVGPADGR